MTWVTTVALALIGVAVTMLFLAVGALFGRRPLRGSCADRGGACVCGAHRGACPPPEERP